MQWATGNIGTRSLQGVIGHPDLSLVGSTCTSPDKAGVDAGELSGLAPTGVVATTDIEDILGLGADCVLYMPRVLDVDEVCRLLASGANIVTTRGEFHHPGSMDADTRERVEAACRAGGTSIYSTGSSPGFISEAVPLVLTSIQRELESLRIEEFADLSMRNSPELLFDLMGFGADPDSFDPARWSHGAASFGPSLRLLGEALGLPLDSVEATGQVAVARQDTQIAAGPLAAGTVAAQRMRVTGLRGGHPLLVFEANWYCTADLEPAWDLGPTGWRVTVAGDAPLRIDMAFDFPSRRWPSTPPATRPTGRSTRWRWSASRRRASARRWTCPR